MKKPVLSLLLLVKLLVVWAEPAEAQLRIVTYNTARGGPREGLGTVLEAIGNEIVGGLAKPIDVLALQEQRSAASTTSEIVALLNGIYGTGTYAMATLDGGTTGGGVGAPGLIYNTTTVALLDQRAFGELGDNAQARQTLRYQLRPLHYGPAADCFIYSNHYKAGTTREDKDQRNIEAVALRADLDSLGEGTHAILVGDFNIQSWEEGSYQTLLAPGPGQAFDPLNAPGVWHDNEEFRWLHTQAPAKEPADSALTGGGMDDRFDFQLVTGELLDGEGLDYIPGSYRAFGNNGTHELNGDITSGTGAAGEVLAALAAASDHLPVVADYRLPALLVGDYNGNGRSEQADLDLVLLQ